MGGKRSDAGCIQAYLTWEINFDGLDANIARTGGHDVGRILGGECADLEELVL